MLSKPETPYKPFPLFKLPMVAANEVMLCMPIVDIPIINLMRDSQMELTIKRNDGRKAVLSTFFNNFFQKFDFLMNVN
ncbi:F-box domain-containing protein [Caenorhabditis elegans]|uniref:F-box domain-containing protein n=1 Tax=Caenorhabditis elegans TaxID=6239 RepID=U4PBG4_CAEEL|nr:F-box domain-containing protein [Caenorhabditis elegans]CDH93060.1 F-box domain-containing protein [Caenorhabditis elegans]|eukprot:NP_001293554.1 Uncharacterized protein CELE_Y53F4B.62 [Caenorhabditis elegans]